MLLSWLVAQIGNLLEPFRPERRSRPIFRPFLELLEGRVTPSGTYTWKGGTANAANVWENTNNWNKAGTNQPYPGANGSIDDDVVFDNTATADAFLKSTITVNSLNLKPNFTRTLEVQANAQGNANGLTIAGNVPIFMMQSGTLNLKGSSWLALSDLNLSPNGDPKAVWSGGDLSKNGDVNAKIYVYNRSEWVIKADALNLGATIILGQSKTGADSPATVDLATTDGQGNLSSNLTLYKNANINVMPQGFLNLNQTVNSDTKGGIVNGAGSTGTIDNKGTINRKVADPNAARYLTIGPKVTNSDAGATFFQDKNTKVNFAGGFDLNAGQYKKIKGADNKGDVNVNGGQITLRDDGTGGAWDVYFSGNVYVLSGTIDFGGTGGGYGTMHVTGDFSALSGASVNLRVDGSTSENCDNIQVDGTATVTLPTVNVNTQNSSPTSGYTYTFLSAGSFSGMGGWVLGTLSGYSASYVFDDPFGRLKAQ
jgi:hypothetical protein